MGFIKQEKCPAGANLVVALVCSLGMAGGCALSIETGTQQGAIQGPGGGAPDEYPSTAVVNLDIVVTNAAGTQRRFACSGSLIQPTIVLTAGHCVTGMALVAGPGGDVAMTVTAPYAGPDVANVNGSLDAAPEGVFLGDQGGIGIGLVLPDIAVLSLDRELPGTTTLPMTNTCGLLEEPTTATIQVFGAGRTERGIQDRANPRFYRTAEFPAMLGRSSYAFLHGAAVFDPGDSGGPLLNGSGQIVGVVATTSGHAQRIDGYGGGSNADRIAAYLAPLCTTPQPERPPTPPVTMVVTPPSTPIAPGSPGSGSGATPAPPTPEPQSPTPEPAPEPSSW